MDKIKIQEIAAEAGLSNNDLLEKAKELGFDVKAANSTISIENADMLVNYAISGKLPKGFKKPSEKNKPKVIKKVEPKIQEDISSVAIVETQEPKKEKDLQENNLTEPNKPKIVTPSKVFAQPHNPLKEKRKIRKIQPVIIEEVVEQKTVIEQKKPIKQKTVIQDKIIVEEKTLEEIPSDIIIQTPQAETIEVASKEIKKRKGISVADKEESSTAIRKVADEEDKPKKKTLSRSGIKIVRRARPEPVIVKPKSISQTVSKTSNRSEMVGIANTKKKNKKLVEARETGKKIDLFDKDFSTEISSGFEEDEIVLLDFSDKNMYDEMIKEEQRRKEELKKREAAGVTAKARQHFKPQTQQNIRRTGKRKKYVKEIKTENVTSIEIPENVRVYEFAEKVNRSIGEVVKVLFSLGMMVTKNDFLSKDEIEILSQEFEVEVTTMNPLDELDYVGAYDAIEDEYLEERPPVITIMGHVDHGKTSLLDKIRSTKVAAKEAGGITQHVGAYQVEKNGKKITFVDTPGHEAFTEMRSRGAQATDIVIIVVAADDGVMLQTKEAISHTKAANVPMIIAINKMDKPTANPDNVKKQLADLGILATEWGGEYDFIPVSAHTGLGIDVLLETILLQAEIMELNADPKRKAKAVVVESSLEKGFGPVANVIIQNGTLRVGDNAIAGSTYGRIKAIKLDDGTNVKEIGPSTPAAIVGLNEVPAAGDILIVMESEKEARELAEKRAEYAREKVLSRSTKASLDDLQDLIAEGKLKSLPVVIKADVQGSLEAIKGSLEKLRNDEVKVNIIHEGVGGITDSDVTLASASGHCVVLGFNVRPTGAVKQKAKDLGVEVKSYSIIYELLDDVRALLGGMMSPVISEEVTGQAEVRMTFVVGKVGTIAGCKVSEGVITRNSKARLIRNGVVVKESTIASLKRLTEDVREVRSGYECGIMLDNFNDIKEGDVIETYKSVQEMAVLE